MKSCDIVDESGRRTGRVVARGTILSTGEFYPVVHVWIRDEAGRYLIQQRAAHLENSPGVWAVTAGHIHSGEHSLAAALRETAEELGLTLTAAQLRRFDSVARDNVHADLWLAEVTSDSIGPVVPGPDVSAWRWVEWTELEAMVRRGDFFGYSYLRDLPA